MTSSATVPDAPPGPLAKFRAKSSPIRESHCGECESEDKCDLDGYREPHLMGRHEDVAL
jgi:hypothetical protein